MAKFILLLLLFTSILPAQTIEDKSEWKSFYDNYHVTGCLVIYDLNKDEYFIYNKERCRTSFIPASTYKILNSLIALETGVIKDENQVIPWDSVNRQYNEWNKDQTLRTAIKYSAVWVYQKIAREIGQERMQHYVDDVQYGNSTIGGGIDRFWLDGDLRISSLEQVEFLKRLYADDLPFSKRNTAIVKDIIINDKTGSYTLRGKTGWAIRTEKNIGWYVGYLVENDNVYFFANNIDMINDNDAAARIDIVKEVFKSMGLLK